MPSKSELRQNKKVKSCKEGSNCDGIMKLPNEILISIFSNLTMREVANASLVTRKWRLPCASIPNLVFDWNSMFELPNSMFELPYGDHFRCPRWPCKQCANKLVSGVNQFIQSYKGERVVSFSVNLPIDIEHYACDISRWVKFSLDMGVERLDLDLRHRNISRNRTITRDFEVMPRFEFRSHRSTNTPKLTHLFLRSCILGPSVIELFSCLKSLTLFNVPLGGQDEVESILSTCSKLEFMELRRCLLPPKLCIFGSVKDLTINSCYEVKEIEIFAPRLTNFTCFDSLIIKFSNSKVSNLKKVDFRISDEKAIRYVFRNLGKDHPLLESLIAYEVPNLVHWLPKGLTPFASLNKLKLQLSSTEKLDVLNIIAILNASPLLETLHLDICSICYPRKIDLLPESVHKHIKDVFIGGLYFPSNCLEFVYCMLEYTVSLVRMIIQPRSWCMGMTPDRRLVEEVRSTLQGHPKSLLITCLDFIN